MARNNLNRVYFLPATNQSKSKTINELINEPNILFGFEVVSFCGTLTLKL